MINYIFELLSFICAIASYIKGDVKSTAIWLVATVILGFCGTLSEIFIKARKENKNG